MKTKVQGVDRGILATCLPGSIAIIDTLGSCQGSFSSSAGPMRRHSFSFVSLPPMSFGEGISASLANHEELRRWEHAKQQTLACWNANDNGNWDSHRQAVVVLGIICPAILRGSNARAQLQFLCVAGLDNVAHTSSPNQK